MVCEKFSAQLDRRPYSSLVNRILVNELLKST